MNESIYSDLQVSRMKKNIKPKNVLDIGANYGMWSISHKVIWPNASFFMIEANQCLEQALKDTCDNFLAGCGSYMIAVLAERSGIRDWWSIGDTGCTGDSLYKESGTDFYEEVTPVRVATRTLEQVIDYSTVFEYVKIDTQGSELEIMRGGDRIIRNANHLELEVSLTEYNKGAPLKEEVVEYCKSKGFGHHIVLGHNGCQQDILFSRPIEIERLSKL